MQSMFLKGDRQSQQRFCDAVLNQASAGELEFRVVSDFVLFTCMYVKKMGSLDPIDKDKGVMPEIDIGFWTPVFGGSKKLGALGKFFWLPSFLFVDSGSAMAGGREIFGYPKTDAVIERLNPIPEDPSVDVKVLHFKKYGPHETPNREPLVRVVKIDSSFEDPGLTSTSSKEELWLNNDLAPYFNLDSLIPPEIGVTMPQILMRQFHDSTQFSEAIFREVITLPIRADSFAAVGRIMGTWEIVLAPSASHPIAATLGLQSSNTAQLSFWSQQNFTVPTAHRIWP